MTKAVISLGSNLGDREANIKFALNSIAEISDIQIVKTSSIYESEPVGGIDQASFLNAVVVVETNLNPNDLLENLQTIENLAGRTREIKWGPRTLDLDIIDIEGFVSNTEKLQVPHPRALERKFVLQPLAEIYPNWKLFSQDVKDLVHDVSDQVVNIWGTS